MQVTKAAHDEDGTPARDPEPGHAVLLPERAGAAPHRARRTPGQAEHLGVAACARPRGAGGRGRPMTRLRGSGSLRLRGGIWCMRYYHHGRQVEESTGYRTADRSKAETV